MDYLQLLGLTESLARQAGELASAQFRQVDARRKRDGTLVTDTDEQLDRLITTQLKDAFPDHAVLSEEQTTIYDPEVPYTWVVDPVDGTTNFVRGLPLWGVSIALLRHGDPVLGVVNFPLTGEIFSAVTGMGASRSGTPITTSWFDPTDDQQLLVKCTRTDRRFRVHTAFKERMLGSAAYHVCKIADGTAVAGIESAPKVWDLAAATLILREAGGCFSTADHGSVFPLAPVLRDYGKVIFPVLCAAGRELLDDLFDSVSPVGT